MKNPFKKLFQNLFSKSSSKWKVKDTLAYLRNRKDGETYFDSLSVHSKTPSNSSIEDKDFIQVIYKGKPMWALFKCPCGCNTMISLSLQQVHKPHWTLTTKNNRPTLYPSIWQKTGCCSHFWVYNGCIYWE